MGFGMALAQNVKAMEIFSSLSENKQRMLIERTHSISSKDEMHSFVQQIAQRNIF